MSRARTVAAVGVLSALFGASALITIPLPAMPVTLQCFAVALGAFVFGSKAATAAVAVYAAIGAAGLPVFAGMQGGVQVLVGPTGGFIWGFFLLAVLCGIGKDKGKALAVILGLLGLCACYTLGLAQYALITGTGLGAAFISVGSFFLVKDIILTLLAYPLSIAVINSLNKAERRR